MKLDTVLNVDCIDWMRTRRKPFVDLVFADPPFNIGYQYDVYEDRKAYHDYYDWTHDWMKAAAGLLKPTGSMWVAIGAEYAAEIRMIGRALDLCLRNWVIWHYTFGQSTKAKFARAHTHLFYFTKDPREFTFHADAVRVMSDRQKEYCDKRANPLGKLPFDVWTEFPRLCGSFQAREGWHPCQMPESVLARIIRACSSAGDVVLDPFAGSGTTLVVAKKLARKYLGLELSEQYVAGIRDRLARVGEPAPKRRRRKRKKDALAAANTEPWPAFHVEELASLYLETGLSTDTFLAQPFLFDAFCRQFTFRLANTGFDDGYTPEQIWYELEEMRMDAKLGRIKTHVQESTERRSRPAPQGHENGWLFRPDADKGE